MDKRVRDVVIGAVLGVVLGAAGFRLWQRETPGRFVLDETFLLDTVTGDSWRLSHESWRAVPRLTAAETTAAKAKESAAAKVEEEAREQRARAFQALSPEERRQQIDEVLRRARGR